MYWLSLVVEGGSGDETSTGLHPRTSARLRTGGSPNVSNDVMLISAASASSAMEAVGSASAPLVVKTIEVSRF